MSISPPLPSKINVDDDILLRPYFETSPEDAHALIHRNIDHLSPFMAWATPEYTVDGVKAFLEASRQRWYETGEHGYAIYYKGELAGSVGIRGLDSPVRAASIGYWLSGHLQGYGIMTRCVEAGIRLAFVAYNMNQVVIRAATHNTRSRAIPERLGFKEVGIERQMTVNAAGELFYLVNYSLLKDEWKSQQGCSHRSVDPVMVTRSKSE